MTTLTPEKYRLAVEGMQDHAVFMMDAQGNLLTWNRGVERILGYTEGEWVGRHLHVIFPHEDNACEVCERQLENAAANGRAEDVRWYIRKDGTRFWGDSIVEWLEGGADEFRGYVVVLRDATRKHEAEERYRTLFESIDVGFCIIEMLFDEETRPQDYRFLEINPAFVRHTGLIDAVGRRVRELIPHHDAHWFEIYGRVALMGESVRFENRAEAMGRWFDVYALRIGAPEERKVGVLFTDITARKEVQEALIQSEERLRDAQVRLESALSAGEIATWTFDIENDRIVADANLSRLFSLRPEAALGSGLSAYMEAIHPDDRTRVAEAINDAVETRDVYEIEYRVLLPDGSTRWLAARGKVERNPDGRAIALPGVVVDITAHREAAEALTRSEARFRLQADAMPQMVWATDADGNHLYYNRRWYEYTGQSVEESLGFGFTLALHPDDAERTLEQWRRAWEGGADYEIEYRFRRHDGLYRWFVGRAEPVRDPNTDEITMWVGTCTDIDDGKRAQAELERLYMEAQARAERETLINQIGDGIRQSLPPEEIEKVAVEALGRALNVDRCYVFTTDINRDSLVIAREWCAAGVVPIAGEYRLSEMGIDVEAVFSSGENLIVSHLQGTEERLSDENAAANQRWQVSSLVNVPFYENGRFVGALSVAMASGPREWTSEEVTLVETVAGQLRSTVEAARLQQRERHIAQQLQEALQPVSPSGLPGLALEGFYKPALEEAGVGGDFYDVFPVGKGCTALVVGDLSGKGLAAASEVATVRNMVRYAVYSGRTLAEAITDLDRILVGHDLLVGFATLFVGLYDQTRRMLIYVNCGQEPGLIWRSATREVEQLLPTGPVLGGFESADGYSERRTQLLPGDVLALFTDGMTEVGPSRKELLEVEGLTALFAQCCTAVTSLHELAATDAAVQVRDSLIAGVEAHAGGTAVGRDDIALLVGVVEGVPEPF